MQLKGVNMLMWSVLCVMAGCKSTPGKEQHSNIQSSILANAPATDWSEYNGDASRSHYSMLDQINTKNTMRLKAAWTYASTGNDSTLNGTQMQCNPIIIDGILYGVSATIQAFALDAANGKELWKTHIYDNGGTLSRGVTYYADSASKTIFFGAGHWLYALDAETGDPIKTFGNNGRIDLLQGIQRPNADKYVVSNTPNTIFKNTIIVGDRVAESETALLGDIRSYDVHTGKLIWTFKTIPEPGQPGYNTWSPDSPRLRIGGANAWAGMALDRQREIIYAPTGSAAFDFYGGTRKGDDLFANCLLALDANTGRLIWHYQLVHHDIWDRDPPSPPNLLTILHNGVKTDIVAQLTKQGYVFVFDRVTGKPIFNIPEKKFPGDGISGEYPSPTQPVPELPVPFTRQSFTKNDVNSFVADKDSVLQQLSKARTGSAFIPLTKQMTIVFPGTDGGAQWGGAAVDKEGILYVPAKEIPVYTSLAAAEDNTRGALTADKLYISNCSACHGADKMGSHDGSYPSLEKINKKLSENNVLQLLSKGRGMMPSFAHLPENDRKNIADYLLNIQTKNTVANVAVAATNKLPYRHTGYNRWYDKNGYPVNTPPWGTLTAIDMNTGLRKWQIALGEYKALMDKGMPATGTDNYGGPLVTAGGVIFIAATRDEKFRAIDKNDGHILWQIDLPAAGYASPSTYSIKGKQYVVIACGGGKLKTKSGDKYVAFCLDDAK